MPCFGAANVHNMFDDMMDVISQLLDKWTRLVFSFLVQRIFVHISI